MQRFKLLGPPGTGKTSALMDLLKGEVDRGTRPEQVTFLTFTKGARSVALREAAKRFGLLQRDLPYFGTLHSICFKLMGLHKEAVVRDTADLGDFAAKYRVEFSKPVGARVDFDGDVAQQFGSEPGDQLLLMDHCLRHKMLPVTRQTVRDWSIDLNFYEAERFCRCYRAYKSRENLVDFTDMLEQARGVLPVKVVFVDEAQDLSVLQWETLKRVTADAERMYLAGDDDQSIFDWAGASPETFSSMKGESKVLGQSYRLPKSVHRIATRISSLIRGRHEKPFAPRNSEGEARAVESLDDLKMLHGDQWLVLVRNHYLTRSVTERLKELGVPFSVGGIKSVPEDLAAAVESWEGLKLGRDLLYMDAEVLMGRLKPGLGVESKEAQKRARGLDPSRMYSLLDLQGMGMTGLELPWEVALQGYSSAETAYLSKVRATCGSLLVEPTVKVSTIHAAKGAEADHVALLGAASKRVIESADLNRDSELRVMYVGATRAKVSLTLVGDSEVLGPAWRA